MINDDSKWSAPYHPTPKTEQDFITLREFAKKKAMELLAGTEAGRRMVNMMRSKKKK